MHTHLNREAVLKSEGMNKLTAASLKSFMIVV